MAGRDLHDLGAAEAARRIRAGELTAEALATALLERIAARDGDLAAWAHVDPDLVLAQARRCDAGEPSGPLHGVPVGVKDIIDTADLPTEHGTPVHAGNRPDRDATCVARLRAAGAVVLGKTVTTELALFHPGPTRNPHDPTRTPGGSSSGSAAAVADRMVPVALGTQTAGSVVRPASFCGTYGFKPTFGALDTAGVKVVSPSLDTLGVFARDPDDLALVAGVLADDPGPYADTPPPRRLGFLPTAEWPLADLDTQDRLEALVEALAAELEVEERSAPASFAQLVEAQTTVMGVEAARHLTAEMQHADQLSDRLRRFLKLGADRAAAYDEAVATRDRARADLDRLFGDHEVLLTPAVVGEAPAGLDTTGDPLFCRAWTLLGTPAVAVPGLRGRSGLPLGVQVVARPGHDGAALAAARWLGRWLAHAGGGPGERG